VIVPPREAVNVRVAEYPFRVAMLTVASRIRDLFPAGRIEIPVAILGTRELRALPGEGVESESVGVSFQLPCPVDSAEEIDDYLVAGTGGDLSMANADRLLAEIGGRLLVHAAPGGPGSLVLLSLPRYDLKS
jgi:hypothetical protein